MTRNMLIAADKYVFSRPMAGADERRVFVQFALECGVLSFGSSVTKSGRTTPYFFNAGGFNTGARLGRLAEFYANAIRASAVEYDMVFGPAYKGIALAVDKRDNGTRELLESILEEEEDGIDWLEAQLHIVKQIGMERYLSEQLHE